MSGWFKAKQCWIETLSLLNDADFRNTVTAIWRYEADGSMPSLTGMASIAFTAIRQDIDEAKSKQSEISRARSAAGSKGGKSHKKTEPDAEVLEEVINQETAETTAYEPKPKGEEKKKQKRFVPPTIEEVKALCTEKGYKFSPERFIAYYESNGWRVGKNPMKDWKAACRTWASNTDGTTTGGNPSMPKVVTENCFQQRPNTENTAEDIPEFLRRYQEESKAEETKKEDELMPDWM